MSLLPTSLRSTEASDGRSPSERNFGPDLDNIFRLAGGPERSRPPAPAPASEPRRMTQPDLDAALEMLNRAAKAMDLLQSRYQHVESYAKDLAERAERDLALASSQAKDWEIRAAEDEARIQEAKLRLAEAERRANRPNAGPKRSRTGPTMPSAAPLRPNTAPSMPSAAPTRRASGWNVSTTRSWPRSIPARSSRQPPPEPPGFGAEARASLPRLRTGRSETP